MAISSCVSSLAGPHERRCSEPVTSASADQSQLSVYGALRSDGALTVAVINQGVNDLTRTLNLANFNPRTDGPGLAIHRLRHSAHDRRGRRPVRLHPHLCGEIDGDDRDRSSLGPALRLGAIGRSGQTCLSPPAGGHRLRGAKKAAAVRSISFSRSNRRGVGLIGNDLRTSSARSLCRRSHGNPAVRGFPHTRCPSAPSRCVRFCRQEPGTESSAAHG